MEEQVHWPLLSLRLPEGRGTWAEGTGEEFGGRELSERVGSPLLFSRAGDQTGVSESGAERAATVLVAAETSAPHPDHKHQALLE